MVYLRAALVADYERWQSQTNEVAADPEDDVAVLRTDIYAHVHEGDVPQKHDINERLLDAVRGRR